MRINCFAFATFSQLASKVSSMKILSTTHDLKTDLMLIRHGQSTFNVACQEYRKKHNIPYIWKELCNHQGFDQKVLFNIKYIDCPLTETGKDQCRLRRQKILKDWAVDCVLVSPQLRALETCSRIFQKTPIPVFVEPLLVGPLRSCSDVNRSTEEKIKKFPNYNFSAIENLHELWYLNYLDESQRNICEGRFQEKKILSIDEQRIEMVQLLKEGRIQQNSFGFRKRVQELKIKIADYRQRYSRIAIVSHYYTIEYLGAADYEQESGKPINYIDIKNCQPYYASLADILSYKGTI